MELIKGHEVGCYIFPNIEISLKSKIKLLQTALSGDTIIAASAGSLTRDSAKALELGNRYSLVLLDKITS
ncbi:hypothetical protein [Paenibacillus odorifer]|uniref:DeoR C-terminal sensor domain-containing protein n=1 Tax=Paenibacillus odorifer TaxID=189426 RepID=A0ABX3HGZ4_9BACL|nr:hypothetical protein [Paenibacillus odorifer]OMD48530.1 hypothetical protein BSK51_21605 [Paenibacillus odorifer]